MEHLSHGSFQGLDGRQLAYRHFQPEHPAGTLIMLHGHGEHSGRYEKFFGELRSEGFSVAVYDFRGHGQSEGPDVYIDRFDEYVDDVTSFMTHLEKRHPLGRLRVLFGHSLGGLTAVHWALRHPEQLDGLILSSPCLGLHLPPYLVKLNAFLNRVAPGLLYRNPVMPSHLTHDAKEKRVYQKDLEIKRRISVRLLHEALLAMERLRRQARFDFQFPVCILAAGKDKVVRLAETHRFYERLKAPEKDMRVFKGFYHEIFNEDGQEEAFEALRSCLKKIRRRTPASHPGP